MTDISQSLPQDPQKEENKKTDIEGEVEVAVRTLHPFGEKLFFWFAAAISAFHIWANTLAGQNTPFGTLGSPLSTLWIVCLHFSFLAVLCALRYPIFTSKSKTGSFISLIIDIFLAIMIAGGAIVIIGSQDEIYNAGTSLTQPYHWVAAICAIVGAIELTRRTTGWIIPILIMIAMLYASQLNPILHSYFYDFYSSLTGERPTSFFEFRGFNPNELLSRLIFDDEGLFGFIGRISATVVAMFLIFSAFLLKSGASQFIIDMGRIVAGRFIGGPGFVAVFSSGLTGTISGSALANTVSTGVITIPFMKKSGFPPRFAAGVEAAASTGGQMMPPIMGAGAFIMASITQISYVEIIAVAFLPALIYFLSIIFFVRMEAKKNNMKLVTENVPDIKKVLLAGGPTFILPVALLMAMLIIGFTPTFAAGWAIICVVVASWFTPNAMGPRAIIEALAMGTKNMITVGILLVSVGLIVDIIAGTGIGPQISQMIQQWSGGNLLIALVLVAIASLLLGMGLPVTAAYIILGTVSAPALQALIQNNQLVDILMSGNVPEASKVLLSFSVPDLAAKIGTPMSSAEAWTIVNAIPPNLVKQVHDSSLNPAVITAALLSAHMIIFWLSQDSNVTPPVCLTAFAAAAIAKTPPMQTGFTAWKLAKGMYLVPVLFAYTPFLYGTIDQVLWIFITGVFGVYAMGACLQGYMEARLNWPLRILAGLAGLALIWPSDYRVQLAGFVVFSAIFAHNIWLDRQKMAAEAEAVAA